jgi:GNAT superfamily N-acetyltransferase
VRIEPLGEAQIEDAGRLLAARHVEERRHFPILAERYEDATGCAEIVAGTMKWSTSLAAVGDDDERLLGFLSAWANVPDPSSPAARFSPERSAMYVMQGHAVAPDADAFGTYHALFAAHAERFLDDDITDHVVHVPAGDARTREAWHALGFGGSHAVAVRDLSPPPNGAPVTNVRQATEDDLDIVDRLLDEETKYHASSPILRPYVREQTKDAVRAELTRDLAGVGATAYLLARVDSEDVGVLSIGPTFGSPLGTPEGAAYIGGTAVLDHVRGRGIGAALLAAAVAWAADHGHRALMLHYATPNVLSSSFWTGQGFVPVMWHLRRRLDERIRTMRPTPR